MFSPLRNRFGIPGAISVIALVFAMMGGAYAASNDGGGANATASAKKSKKAKKGPRGPKGKAGPAGPAGPAGANGNDGQNGSNGSKGDKGDKGDAGSQGEKGEKGAKGDKGAPGDPWTVGGTLPAGKTETGVWAAGTGPVGFKEVPISFTIPLSEELDSDHVHYINLAGEEVQTLGSPVAGHPACDGTAANPAADPGHLCIYTGAESETLTANSFIAKVDDSNGANKSGAILGVVVSNEFGSGGGSWAVTAEEE